MQAEPARELFAHFTVFGPPQPWQRAGSTRKGVRYTQAETKRYQLAIKTSWLMVGQRTLLWPKDCRYRLHVVAYFADNRRRDLDNVLKSVCDALNGVAYHDDSQINVMHVERWVDEKRPRTLITVEVIG